MVEFLLFLFCKFVSQNTMIPLNISTQPVLIAWRTSFVNWSGSKSIRASWGYELAIIYPTSPVWCRIIVDGGGRGRGKVRRQLLTPSFPLWYKFLSLPSLPLTFQWENTEYLLTKIIFALLAKLPEDQIEYDIPSFTHEAGWITVKCAIWFFLNFEYLRFSSSVCLSMQYHIFPISLTYLYPWNFLCKVQSRITWGGGIFFLIPLTLTTLKGHMFLMVIRRYLK